MTVEEAVEIIKQVPLYRYECELEKGRQSDLFQALYMAIQALEEVQAYRAIGTVEDFKALKEKNEPKKIEKMGYVFVCPICKKWLQSSQEICHGCGQKLDWQ